MKNNKTKQRLADALMEIAQKKSISKITIREIAEKCDVSSQTFYNHFVDKYDLVLWIHKTYSDGLIKDYEEGSLTLKELIAKNLEFYMEHASFMINAITNTYGSDSYWYKSVETVIDTMKDIIRKKFSVAELTYEEEIHINMYAYSFTELHYSFAKDGIRTSIDDAADIIISAMPRTIVKYFN